MIFEELFPKLRLKLDLKCILTSPAIIVGSGRTNSLSRQSFITFCGVCYKEYNVTIVTPLKRKPLFSTQENSFDLGSGDAVGNQTIRCLWPPADLFPLKIHGLKCIRVFYVGVVFCCVPSDQMHKFVCRLVIN
jgi:hypothetical protein